MKTYLKRFTFWFSIVWVITTICMMAVFLGADLNVKIPGFIPVMLGLLVANELLIQKHKQKNQKICEKFRKKLIMSTSLITVAIQALVFVIVAVAVKFILFLVDQEIAAIIDPVAHAQAVQEKLSLIQTEKIIRFFDSSSWIVFSAITLLICFATIYLFQRANLSARKFNCQNGY